MDNKYIAYEKIPENINKWNLTELDYRTLKKTDWLVTEKIYGANFGIITDGLEIKFAKRKEFLDSTEDFFGYQLLQDKLVLQARKIFQILQLEKTTYTKYLFMVNYLAENIHIHK